MTIRRYRAMANHAAMLRLVTTMPLRIYTAMCNAAYDRGETVAAYVGRIALRAERIEDIDFVEETI